MTTSYVLCFDGQTTWVEGGALDLSPGDYTIEAWFLANRGGGALFEAAAPVVRSPHALMGVSICLDASGALTCTHATQAKAEHRVSFITPASYRDGTWHHVALVKNKKRLTLYVDGTAQGSMSGAEPLSKPLQVSLGRRAAATQPDRALAGALAEVRVWQRARSPKEILADLRGPLTGREAGLARSWPLSDGAGRSARDRSKHGAPAQLHGTYVWREVPVAWEPEKRAPRPAEHHAETEPPRVRRRSSERDRVSDNTTGLEDYARWKQLYGNRKAKGDPPFRRGRIWA